MSSKELSCDSCTNSENMTLTKRTRSVFNTTSNLKLWVTSSRRAPLAKLLQLFESELADKAELRIEHRGHMTRIEEETVATNPRRVLWIILQILRIEHVDEVGTTHSTTWVTRLCLFYSRCSENTDVVSCMQHYFVIVHKMLIFKLFFYLILITAIDFAGILTETFCLESFAPLNSVGTMRLGFSKSL